MEKVNLVNVCEFFECEIPVIEMVTYCCAKFNIFTFDEHEFQPFQECLRFAFFRKYNSECSATKVYLQYDKRVFSSRYISF